MNRHLIAALNTAYALIGAIPAFDIRDHKRVIGVDRLTGLVMEQRVAIEATRYAV